VEGTGGGAVGNGGGTVGIGGALVGGADGIAPNEEDNDGDADVEGSD
jgi:hypothetical protein